MLMRITVGFKVMVLEITQKDIIQVSCKVQTF